MKLHFLALALGMTLPISGQQPAAEDILRGARQATLVQNQELSGQLRRHKGKGSVPVKIFMRGTNIQFQFFNQARKAWEVFHLRLNNDGHDLFEMRGGKTHRFPAAKLKEPIMGTDLSYEDLALRFLYWPGGQVLKEERLKTRACWLLRLKNPRPGVGLYAVADVWVDQKSGALMRVIGYDRKGQPLKRFEVQEVMQVGKAHALQKMRVERFNRRRVVDGVTYLELDKPKKRKPAGMR